MLLAAVIVAVALAAGLVAQASAPSNELNKSEIRTIQIPLSQVTQHLPSPTWYWLQTGGR